MCILCLEAPTHKSPHSGETWNINSEIDCDTKNVIYKLGCEICPTFLYIGESSRRPKDRYYGHRSNVLRKQMDTPAGHHFNLPGHNVDMMTMLPFERVRPANDPFVRLTRESWWIRQYDSEMTYRELMCFFSRNFLYANSNSKIFFLPISTFC